MCAARKEQGYTLVREFKSGKRLWSKMHPTDFYLTGKSGDGTYGAICSPDESKDGPIRLVRPKEIVLEQHSDGLFFATVPCVKERFNEMSLEVFQIDVAVVVAEAWRIPIMLRVGDALFELNRVFDTE